MTDREWEYVDAPFNSPYIYDNVSNRIIATMYFVGAAVERTDSPDRDFPETRANGRVMVQAWDLLEACESARDVLLDMTRAEPAEFITEQIEILNGVIAKARGTEAVR